MHYKPRGNESDKCGNAARRVGSLEGKGASSYKVQSQMGDRA